MISTSVWWHAPMLSIAQCWLLSVWLHFLRMYTAQWRYHFSLVILTCCTQLSMVSTSWVHSCMFLQISDGICPIWCHSHTVFLQLGDGALSLWYILTCWQHLGVGFHVDWDTFIRYPQLSEGICPVWWFSLIRDYSSVMVSMSVSGYSHILATAEICYPRPLEILSLLPTAQVMISISVWWCSHVILDSFCA